MEWLHGPSWETELHTLAQNPGFGPFLRQGDKFVDQHKRRQNAVDDRLGTSLVLNIFFLGFQSTDWLVSI